MSMVCSQMFQRDGLFANFLQNSTRNDIASFSLFIESPRILQYYPRPETDSVSERDRSLETEDVLQRRRVEPWKQELVGEVTSKFGVEKDRGLGRTRVMRRLDNDNTSHHKREG